MPIPLAHELRFRVQVENQTTVEIAAAALTEAGIISHGSAMTGGRIAKDSSVHFVDSKTSQQISF